jgi:hypothetical protein
VIDVDAVMADLRTRVAEKKARGLYGVDALVMDQVPGPEPFAPEELERVRALAVLHYDVAVGPSTKPALGGLLTRVKSTLVRGVSQPGYSLTAQLNAYHGSLVAYLARMAREMTRLQKELAEVRGEAQRAANAVREAEIDRQRDLGQLEGRVEELADLLRSAEVRIAQLEGGDPPQG